MAKVELAPTDLQFTQLMRSKCELVIYVLSKFLKEALENIPNETVPCLATPHTLLFLFVVFDDSCYLVTVSFSFNYNIIVRVVLLPHVMVHVNK